VRACYFDSILNAYDVRLGGCLADHLAERVETATQNSCAKLLIRTLLNSVDLLANRRESLE